MAVRHIESWLNGWAQSVVTNDTKSNWKPVTTGALGLIQFNLFINDQDNRIECTMSRFGDDTEMGGVAAMLESHATIQRDLVKWRKMGWQEHTKFNKTKLEVLYLERNNPMHPHSLGADELEGILAENVLLDTKLNTSQQCVLTVKKAKSIRRNVVSRSDEGKLALCWVLLSPVRELGLVTPKKRRLKGILSMHINTWREGTENGARLFSAVLNEWNKR